MIECWGAICDVDGQTSTAQAVARVIAVRRELFQLSGRFVHARATAVFVRDQWPALAALTAAEGCSRSDLFLDQASELFKRLACHFFL